jgi:hypothetical protein
MLSTNKFFWPAAVLTLSLASLCCAAALAQQGQGAPPRTAPAPFQRVSLPDPFEHRQAVRLRKPPKEDEVPAGQGSSRPAK